MALPKDMIDYLSKLPPNEPVFVLRAQDILAADVVRNWVHSARTKGCPDTKLNEAFDCATAMDEWPTHKVPD